MRALIAALLLAACSPAFALRVYGFSLVSDAGVTVGTGEVKAFLGDPAGQTLYGALGAGGSLAALSVYAPSVGGFDTQGGYQDGQASGWATFDASGALQAIGMSVIFNIWGYCCAPWSWSLITSSLVIQDGRFTAERVIHFDQNPEMPDVTFSDIVIRESGFVVLPPSLNPAPTPIPEPDIGVLLLIGLAALSRLMPSNRHAVIAT